MIGIDQYRAAIGCFVNSLSHKIHGKLTSFLRLLQCGILVMENVTLLNVLYFGINVNCRAIPLCIILLLLLCSGIHPNPGPALSISHINTQSLYMRSNISDPKQKIDNITLSMANKFDVICLSETWLTNDISNDMLDIDGYTLLRRDSGRMRGGVAVYCNDSIVSTELKDVYPTHSEGMWISMTIERKTMFVGIYYRPPNQSVADIDLFLNELQDSYDIARGKNPDSIYIVGDFNDPCKAWSSNHNKSDLKQLLYQWAERNGLHQLINEPTFYTSHSANVLDLIFTDSPTLIAEYGVLPPIDMHSKIYHCPVFCKIDVQRPNDCAYERHIWKYDLGDYVNLNLELYSVNWTNVLQSCITVSQAANSITNIVLDTSRKYIPNKKVVIRPKDKPWMTGYIRQLLRKRDRAFNKFKKYSSDHYRSKWHAERRKLNAAIRAAKVDYNQKLSSSLSSVNTSTKDFWHFTKCVMGIKSETNIPTIIDEGTFYSTSSTKAELFASYFASQSTIQIDDMPPLPYNDINQNMNIIENIFVDELDVFKILKSLNVKKASGPDLLSNRILRECALSLAKPLQQLFNFSLSSGIFPAQWKVSNTCPIYKTAERNKKNNYRPVSLLCNKSKVLETIVFKHLYLFCKNNNALTWKNSGFKENDSTVLQCLYITQYIYDQLDKGKEVCMVFLDVSKAFDRVWHSGLLYKLEKIGVRGNLLTWFQSYLTDRKLRVVINGQTSKCYDINAGVPQGSVLGPLLFLIYSNDIVENITSHISLFADDTSLYTTVESSHDIDTLNADLNTISQWGKQWIMQFNAQKTKYVLFSRKRNRFKCTLLFNDLSIVEETSHQHLGIVLSNDMSWRFHIDKIISKVSNRLNIMKAIQRKVPRICLESIYEYMIRPIIEYGDVVYDNVSAGQAHELELLQRQAALCCTGGYRHTKYDALLTELGWMSLSIRRKCHRLIILYKILNNYTPPYLKKIIPNTVFEHSPYNLRSSDQLQIPRYNKSFCQKSFLPNTLKEWNKLTNDVTSSVSLHVFKNRIKTVLYLNKKNYFRFVTGPNSVYLCRLRMGLSGLNSHRYKYNFIDSQMCNYCNNAIEDCLHYFLTCPRYAAHREVLIHQLANLLTVVPDQNEVTAILLNGSLNLNHQQNQTLINYVLQFIGNTKRFI